MTTLHRASLAEFQAYREFITSDESPDRAVRQDTDRLLPDGPSTKDQHLLSIESRSKEFMGFVWLTIAERPEGREAFLLDFVIFPRYRRQGIARDVMPLVERYAEGLGLSRISLSVSADNHPARALYEATGFTPVFTRMTKMLKTPKGAQP